MKIFFLGPANSIHLQRWAISLSQRGFCVVVISQHKTANWVPPNNVKIIDLPFKGNAGYFLNAIPLRRILRSERPDLLNAHYASGYGTMAALANYNPTLLSVWGSDVYEFPYQSWLKSYLIGWNLRRATRLASTSVVMGHHISTLAKDVEPPFITPFGVDCNYFAPSRNKDDRYITIGTVKTLASTYGIDVLIKSFSLLLADKQIIELNYYKPLRLLLIGDGPEEESLKLMVYQLGISTQVDFIGQVSHDQVPQWLQKMDIFVAPSRTESFGVAVIEASACGVPVVVSDAGGLPEVVKDRITGLVVPRDDPHALAIALHELVIDPEVRLRFGEAGRTHVLESYEWGRCVDRMISVFDQLVKQPRP